MVERIGSAATAQSMAIRSAKPSEDVKAQDMSVKEESVVQTGESRKRDRFVSSEASLNGSLDDPNARAASDKKHGAAQASDTRSYDRLELSDKALSGLYANTDNGVNVHDMSKTDLSAVESNEVRSNESPDSSEETASLSQSASADDSSESVDTNKLYQYTDTELKDFLLDGSITQSEYDAEIAKREYR